MKINIFSLPALSLVWLMTACGGDSESKEDSLEIDFTPVDIVRLDKSIEGYINLDSLPRVEFMNTYGRELDAFRLIVSPERDSVDNLLLNMWSTWPATTAFMPEVNRIYGDVAREESAIGEIMARAQKTGLSLPYNEFVTVTWGNDKSIVLIDSTVFLSLNHYLGPLNQAYNGWPEYKRRLKSRDMIPVDVSEAMVATAYPLPKSGSRTVLADLVREGALAVAKQRLNPRVAEELILGFTPEQLNDIKAHEEFIWKRLVSDKLLYSSDAEIKSELFDPRPASRIISQDAPGRAVRFVGYQIVKSYLKAKPETPLSSLLSPQFVENANEVLKVSGYNPSKY